MGDLSRIRCAVVFCPVHRPASLPLRRATTGRGAPPTSTLASHQVRPGGGRPPPPPSPAPPACPATLPRAAPPARAPQPSPHPRRPAPTGCGTSDSKRGRRRVRRGRPRQLLLQRLRRSRPHSRCSAVCAASAAALGSSGAAGGCEAGGGWQPGGAAAAPAAGSRRRCGARRSASAGSGDSDAAAAHQQAAVAAVAGAGCTPPLPAGRAAGGPAAPSRRRWRSATIEARYRESMPPEAAVQGPLQAPAPHPRCAIPSRSLPRQRPNQRRCASGASLRPSTIGNSSGVRRGAGGAVWAALPRGQPPKHSAKSRHSCPDSRRPSGVAAVGTQVRAAAAATTRRGSQRGGAVYEKERESKAKEQKRSAASKAADQSTRRGGWRPVGCGAAHEQ